MNEIDEEGGLKAVERLAQKTGRSLEGWVSLVREHGPQGRQARVEWLKREHVLGRYQAQLVADAADNGEKPHRVALGPDEMVDSLYSGKKATLRPIYAALLARALVLGPDVAVRPARAHVSLVRRRLFASVRPSEEDRVELGLVLPEAPANERLVPSVRFVGGDRITHTVALDSPRCVDDELANWLQAAYEANS
ncbi:MAG: DUF5655 domain-containing protein [Polyangia bacterium]